MAGNWWEQGAPVAQPTTSAATAPPPAASRSPRLIFSAPANPATAAKDSITIAKGSQDLQTGAIELADAPLKHQKLINDLAEAKDRPTKEAFDRADKLRADYDALPTVKAYTQALPSYASALQAAPNPQGDLNLIYAYAKIMDPQSVVREGEAASVAGSDTVAGQTVARLQKEIGEGGTFRPEARDRLKAEIKNRISQLNQAFINERVRFKETADRFGINPLDVVGRHPGEKFQNIEATYLGRPVKDVDYHGNAIPAAPGDTKNFDLVPGDAPEGSDDGVRKGIRLSGGDEAKISSFARQASSPNQIIDFARQFGIAITPEDAVKAIDYYSKGGTGEVGFDYSKADAVANEDAIRVKARNDALNGGTGLPGLITQGASFGLSDEAIGAGEALSGLVRGDLNVGRNYAAGRDAERMSLEETRRKTGVLGTLAELGGGVLTGGAGVRSAITSAPALGARVLQGAKAGVLGGATAGFGYGDGAQNSAVGGVLGGVGGGVLGAAIPIGGQVLRDRIGGISRLVGRDPNIARNIVSESLASDANTPRSAGRMIAEGQERGSPMALADTGENARGLLGAVSRRPGGARTITKTAIIERQKAQAERISDAVRRDLGPTANIRDMSESFITKARADAAPLYDEAYQAPLASVPGIDSLISRPSMRRALARAYRIAAEEGRDPSSLGLVKDGAGNVVLRPVREMAEQKVADAQKAFQAADADFRRASATLTGGTREEQGRLTQASDALKAAQDELGALASDTDPVTAKMPSWQTLDYVKRGMDDVVESYRDKTTGKLVLDTEGRAINDTLRTFLNRVDNANPAYARARQAYAGPASLRDALQKGNKALARSADDLIAETKNLSPSETEMYRMGLRKAITDAVAGKGDFADKATALIGTPKKRAALQKIFGGKDGFDRFIATLGDEEAMGQTFKTVATGSPTSERLAFDAATDDTGLAESAMGTAVKGMRDGPWAAIADGLSKIRDAERFGTGKAGDEARESIASLLTETDPAVLDDLIRAAQREKARVRLSGRKAGRRVIVEGSEAGRNIGALVSSPKDARAE